MSTRHWISIVTVIAVAIILYLARTELVQAWHLLWQVNLGILALLVPLQMISYYAVGAMIFSYLRQKEKLNASSVETGKMALELNFVNHLLPSGGVSGASYMTWRLKHLGVSTGRATMAQVVRFVATYGAFLLLLVIALFIITLDGSINRFIILVTSGLASSIIFGTIVIAYVIDSETRLQVFSQLITKYANSFWQRVLRRKTTLVKRKNITRFFEELHKDYRELKNEPRILIRPLIWGFVFNVAEIAMFWVTFLALGAPINPAPLLIGYGLAAVAGFFIVTPGGAGGYELIMITFLSSAGISSSVTVAAILLTRTLLIVGTIISGYVFYQLAIGKYGKSPATS